MGYASRHLDKPECPEGGSGVKCVLEAPGVELQLAKSQEKLKWALSGNNAEPTNIKAMRANTHLDFVFIALYWAIFFLLGDEYRSAISRYLRWAISLAAAFDVLENVRLLRAFTDLERTGVVTVLPRAFSVTKWAAFAVAVSFLGATVLKCSKSRTARTIAVLLFASAVFLLLGIFFGSASITIGGLLLGIPLLSAAVYYAPFAMALSRVLTWIQYFYLMRFQLLAGVLLLLVMPAGYWLVPTIFVGLFDARAFWSLVFVSWAAVQLAWSVMVTARLVLIYGPERFGLSQIVHLRIVRTRVIIAFAALAIPVLAVACSASLDMSPVEKAGAIVVGIVLAIAQLFLTAAFHFASEAPDGHTAAQVFPSFGFLRSDTARKQEAVGERRAVRLAGRTASWIAKWPDELSAGLLRGTVCAPATWLRRRRFLCCSLFTSPSAWHTVLTLFGQNHSRRLCSICSSL